MIRNISVGKSQRNISATDGGESFEAHHASVISHSCSGWSPTPGTRTLTKGRPEPPKSISDSVTGSFGPSTPMVVAVQTEIRRING